MREQMDMEYVGYGIGWSFREDSDLLIGFEWMGHSHWDMGLGEVFIP